MGINNTRDDVKLKKVNVPKLMYRRDGKEDVILVSGFPKIADQCCGTFLTGNLAGRYYSDIDTTGLEDYQGTITLSNEEV